MILLAIRSKNIQVSSIYTTLLSWIAFFLPFQMIGVFVGDYLFSVSVVVTLFFLTAHVLFKKLDYQLLVVALLFLFWCALTSVFRYSSDTYLLSLLVLSVMICQLAHTQLTDVDREVIFRYLALAFWLSVSLSFAEVFLVQLVPALEEILLSDLFNGSRIGEFYGYNRAKGFMREPSFLAIYFAMVYVIVDLRNCRDTQSSLMKIACIAGIVFSMSLSGIVILLSYLATKGARSVVHIGFPTSIKMSTLRTGILILGAGGIFIFLIWDLLFSLSLLVSRRLELSLSLYGQDGAGGSVGSRVNVFLPMLRYWSNEGFWGLLSGVGYGNYDTYLLNEYSAFDRLLSFARGQLSSILAVVGLSVGLVGLLLFIALFFLACLGKHAFLGLPAIIFFVVVMLAYGGLVDYFFWHGLLLARVFSNNLSTHRG